MTPNPRIPSGVVQGAFPEATEIEFLDAGGQSDVWRVTIDGRSEILRVLVRAGDVARVKQEIGALRAIDSDYVMRVFDSRTLEHDGVEHQVIRAEFIDGPSLEVAVGHPLGPEHHRLAIGRPLGGAVEHPAQRERGAPIGHCTGVCSMCSRS